MKTQAPAEPFRHPDAQDWILEQQKITWHDLKDHLPGPFMALLLHLIILPFVVGLVIMDSPEPEKEIQVKSFTEEIIAPKEDPPPPPEPQEPPEFEVQSPTVEKPSPPSETVSSDDLPSPVFLTDDLVAPVLNNLNGPKLINWGHPPGGDGFGTVKPSPGGLGAALKGTFYDLKQTPNGKSTGINPESAASVLKDFLAKGWNQSLLKGYYQSPTPLYTPYIYIPITSADNAPAAYRCADKVKPGCWAAVYRGQVIAPKSGRFRFVGAGDDAICVRFGNQTVFDYGWYQLALGKITASAQWRQAMSGKSPGSPEENELKKYGVSPIPSLFYPYSTMPHWNESLGGLGTGKVFQVEAGQVYPVEILISEIPGGQFGAALLIEDMDEVPVRQDEKTGSPLLPLFRTNPSLPEPAFLSRQAAPFAPSGLVWRATARKAGSSSVRTETSVSDEDLISIE